MKRQSKEERRFLTLLRARLWGKATVHAGVKSFDAFVPETETFIEYDGVRHWKAIYGKEKLAYQQEIDRLKRSAVQRCIVVDSRTENLAEAVARTASLVLNEGWHGIIGVA